MRSKKLISLLCAAAMTASSFAALTVTASAATEDDILWSDTFDNASTGVFLDGTKQNAATNSDAISGLTFVTTNRGDGDAGGYTASDGSYIYNGSYYAVFESDSDATDKYLRLSIPVFGDFTKNGRWAYVSLGESGYAATSDTDVVMDFDVRLENGLDAGVVSTTGSDVPVLRVGSFDADAKSATAVEIDKSALSIGDDWVHARIIVSATSGATLYIDGVEQTSAANANVTALTTIGLYNQDGTATGSAMADLVGNSNYDDGTLNDVDAQTLTPNIDLDNVIIYSETAGVADGTTTAPGAQSQDAGATIAPVATAVPIGTAPVLVAPESADTDTLSSFTFDSDTITKWSLGTAAQTVTAIDGMSIAIGGRSDGGNVNTYAAVVAADSGNVLRLQAGPYAHAGRGPVVSFNESMPVSYDDGTSTAVSFAVKLSIPEGYENAETAAPRLYFLKSTSQAGSDNAGAYNQVAAVLTTVEDETIYRGETDVISTYITPDEWHYVTFVVTPTSSGATQRLYVDGSEDPAVKCDYVGTGDTATYIDDLPLLAVESKAAKINDVDVAPDYSTATIDNILIYQGQPSEPRRMVATVSSAEVEETEAPEETVAPTDVPSHTVTITYADGTASVSTSESEAFDGVLIAAKYLDDGTLDGVSIIQVLSDISTTAQTVSGLDLAVGDKLFVWNSVSGMVPYGSYTVTDTDTSATQKPGATLAPSTEVTTEPSATATTEPSATPTVEPEPTATTEPSATPTVEPTTAPTYTVTGTVDAGVASVALTPAEGDAITGTIDGTTVTFTAVSAGTYTVTVTAADGYKDAVSTPAVITVSDDATAAFTATATAKATSEVTIADVTGAEVTVTGADDLTSVMEGTELTIVASAEDGYVLDDVVVTKDSDSSEVTVADSKFTMPDEAVTVTAEVSKNYVGDIVTVKYSSSDETYATTTYTDSPYLANQMKVSGGKMALSTTDPTAMTVFTVDASEINTTLKTATLSFHSVCSDSGYNSQVRIARIDLDDISEATYMTVTAATAVGVGEIGYADSNGADLTYDLSSDLRGQSGKATYVLYTYTGRGQQITDIAVTAEEGIPITFTVTDSSAEPAVVANATIVVSDSDGNVEDTVTTGDDGTAIAVVDANASYTYTVTSTAYAIKKDGALTVGDEAVAETVVLSDNVATTISITDPADGTTVAAGDETGITYTATVYDQDGRAMTGQTIDWSVTDGNDIAVANVTVTDGKVTATEAAVAGTYTVNATVNGTAVTTTSSVIVSQAAKVTVSITSANTEYGTVSYTVNGVASTDTEVLPGKTVVATATANALYGFVGWATSTDNVTAETYVSTEAEYEYTLQENENLILIAVFEYTGIWYSQDFSAFTANTSVAWNDGWYYSSTDTAKNQNGSSVYLAQTDDENDIYLSTISNTSNGVRHTIHEMDTLSLTTGATIEFDMALNINSDTAQGAEITFAGSDAKIALALHRSGGVNSGNLTYYTTGYAAVWGNVTPLWGTNSTSTSELSSVAKSASALSETYFNTNSEWLHVKLVIDAADTDGVNAGTLTVTDGNSNEITVNSLTLDATDLKYIRLSVGKVAGDKDSQTGETANIDNIVITKAAAVAEGE